MSVRAFTGSGSTRAWVLRSLHEISSAALCLALLAGATSCAGDPGGDAGLSGEKAPTVVVWTESILYGEDSSYNRLHVLDLDQGREWDLGGSEEVYMADPATSGHLVVWQRSVSGEPDDDGIGVRDLVTDKDLALPNSAGRRPQISGDWVVWHQGVEAEGGFRSLLVARNLTSDTERVVEGAADELFDYSISGDWLVWPDGKGIDKGEIWGMRLSTGKRTLLRPKGPWWSPVVAGDWVVYERFDKERVEALDLTTGEVHLLPRGATTACDGESVVIVKGGEAAFQAGRNRMFVYDLASGRSSPTPGAAGQISRLGVSIHGDWVIWYRPQGSGAGGPLQAVNYVSGETLIVAEDAYSPSISKD